MALNVISNFAANIAQRNLKASDQQATNSLNKLSSGSRVVSAKDDAASMAIGSALKAEVMAMEQATVNARQAGSLLQIADGAMANVGEILVRGKMLAVQASSGQFSSTERQMFDNEYQSLLAEIDRIAITTKFAGNLLVNGSVEVAQKANGLNYVNAQGEGYKNYLSKQNGFESITFEEDVPSSVFRFAYNQSTRALTVRNLDTGTSQTVVLANRSIVEGQFETVKFSQLGLTVSLNNLFNKGQNGFPLADGFSAEHKVGDIYDLQNQYISPSIDVTPLERSLGVTQSAVESDGINLTKVGAAFGRLPRVLKMSTVGNIFYMYGTNERDLKTIGIGAPLTSTGQLAKVEVTHPPVLTATDASKLKINVDRTGPSITVTDSTNPASIKSQTISTSGSGEKVYTFSDFGMNITTNASFVSGTSDSGGATAVSSLVAGSSLTTASLASMLAISAPTYRSVTEIETALGKQQAVTPPAIYGILQREGNVYTAELRDMTISSEADRNLVCTLRFTTNNEAKADTDYGSIYLATLSQLVGANSTTVSETKRFNFKLGTAARDTDVLSFNVDGITTEALKLKGSSVINESVAKAASAKVTDAILKLSTVRANVGASQNRLEFASTNLATSIENTEAARSDLLDLDVAREMTTFTSKQILMQAGVAMLAQANQMPQNLLRLFPNAG
jgi:flagellin-like hook-associated protein FlgL